MNTHFDIIITGGTVLVSHPKNPYDIIEESVDIGILNGQITKIGSLSSFYAKPYLQSKRTAYSTWAY